MSPWHFGKKKVIQPCQASKNFLKFFLPTQKLLLFTFWTKCWLFLYRKKQSQYHLVFSVLLNTCFSERDFFSRHPFKCDPHPPWVILLFLTTCSICLCFTLLLPCWVLLLCLFFFEAVFLGAQAGLTSTPDLLPHLPSAGITGAQKHACCFTCLDCFLRLTWNN